MLNLESTAFILVEAAFADYSFFGTCSVLLLFFFLKLVSVSCGYYHLSVCVMCISCLCVFDLLVGEKVSCYAPVVPIEREFP